jgi:hemolysin III
MPGNEPSRGRFSVRRIRLRERDQSPGEEIANSVSHALGGVVAVIAAFALVSAAVERGHGSEVVGATVFAVTMVFVYVTSTVYHGLPRNRAKRVFKILDHSAIFFLIAGTYTPFTLGVMRGTLGWTLLVLVWTLAALGVAFTAVSRLRYPTICTLIYLAMGWLILIGIEPMWKNMEPWGLFWLGAGGLAYTGGVVFFAWDRVRFGHLVWHLCVIAGTACHYIAVYRYSL